MREWEVRDKRQKSFLEVSLWMPNGPPGRRDQPGMLSRELVAGLPVASFHTKTLGLGDGALSPNTVPYLSHQPSWSRGCLDIFGFPKRKQTFTH